MHPCKNLPVTIIARAIITASSQTSRQTNNQTDNNTTADSWARSSLHTQSSVFRWCIKLSDSLAHTDWLRVYWWGWCISWSIWRLIIGLPRFCGASLISWWWWLCRAVIFHHFCIENSRKTQNLNSASPFSFIIESCMFLVFVSTVLETHHQFSWQIGTSGDALDSYIIQPILNWEPLRNKFVPNRLQDVIPGGIVQRLLDSLLNYLNNNFIKRNELF